MSPFPIALLILLTLINIEQRQRPSTAKQSSTDMSKSNPGNLASYLQRAREGWAYKGARRPPFAEEPGAGQESVWDFPRPPALHSSTRHVVVKTPDGGSTIADTTAALRMCETASPPTWYLPWAAVDKSLLIQASSAHTSFCEWKGKARYWKLAEQGQAGDVVAWDYPNPLAGAGYEEIAEMLAFYPAKVQCFVDEERVRPQPGRFYGGWITDDLTGPFKGETGTQGW